MKPSKLLRLGGVLRFYRGKTGKTQSEFAELCNINVVQYRRYENKTYSLACRPAIQYGRKCTKRSGQ